MSKMSSPPMSPEINPPSGPPTTKKRSVRDVCVDETETMRPLKLTAAALISMPPLSIPEKSEGVEETRSVSDSTPMTSQDNDKTEMSDLQRLEFALEYLEKRIEAAAAKREERYEMSSQSPKGSQNSFVVSYSQDSQLSGDEPPSIKSVVEIIVDTLPEMRLQQLFPFGDVDEIDRRVDIAIPFLDTDLGFLHKLVMETMGALREAMK